MLSSVPARWGAAEGGQVGGWMEERGTNQAEGKSPAPRGLPEEAAVLRPAAAASSLITMN